MKYLIIAPAWVGDMVMAQSLFKTLKQQNENAVIDTVAPVWSLPIVERMPEIRKVHLMPLKHGEFGFWKRFKLGRDLRKIEYDCAIILPNSLKSAFIPFWANIPRRTGWRGEMRYGLLNDIRILNKNHLKKMVERFVVLAYQKETVPQTLHCPYPSLSVDQNNFNRLQKNLALSTLKPIIALAPGAEFGTSKQWPARYFAQLIKDKCDGGYEIWLLGSQNDTAVVNSILATLDDATRSCVKGLAGQTTLVDAVDLLANAKALVSNDSGLMHIASAVKCPTVTIYGSTSPVFTPPLSTHFKIIKSDLECSPCFKRSCPYQHGNCMKQLTPNLVINALNELLACPLQTKALETSRELSH